MAAQGAAPRAGLTSGARAVARGVSDGCDVQLAAATATAPRVASARVHAVAGDLQWLLAIAHAVAFAPLFVGAREFVNWRARGGAASSKHAPLPREGTRRDAPPCASSACRRRRRRRDDPSNFQDTDGWKGLGAAQLRWSFTSQQCVRPLNTSGGHPSPGTCCSRSLRRTLARNARAPCPPPPLTHAPTSRPLMVHTPPPAVHRAAVYEPLAWVAKGAQYAAFGLWPKGFVLVSLACHTAVRVSATAHEPRTSTDGSRLPVAAERRPRPVLPGPPRQAAALLLDALLLLTHVLEPHVGRGGACGPAALAAVLLWSVHPLRVEVVAWCSCQPYALAGLFVAGALRSHARARVRTSAADAAAAVAMYACAVLCKAAAVPAALMHVALEALLFHRPLPPTAAAARRPLVRVPLLATASARARRLVICVSVTRHRWRCCCRSRC